MAVRKLILDIFSIISGQGFTWTGTGSGRLTGAVMEGVTWEEIPQPTTLSVASTLTIAQLLTRSIQYTGALATLTMPTAALMDAGVLSTLAINQGWKFSIINSGSGVVTLAGASGVTVGGALGSVTIAAGASGRFAVRRTASSGAWAVQRIA